MMVYSMSEIGGCLLNWRHLTLAFAFALVNAASSTDAARAGESGLFSTGFPPWPAPPNASSWFWRATMMPGAASMDRLVRLITGNAG
jgi:hypothetical protein